ncbi:hypothetical protein TrVE_jg977 [Triparma verrucosa]|uniref:Uncharacterized protein n=1 Tax=Triparma verrucosa TaxID=1606542 RepID=A0A9W7FQ36_9STRA|nr:hypothetical protein TrVE_jg977 [Triparma verrucosa]
MNALSQFSLTLLLLSLLLSPASSFAFSPRSPLTSSKISGLAGERVSSHSRLYARGAKGGTKREDLSYIESRDMTREEMLEYNRQSEEIMNTELNVMTAASLVISLPILYLCWVAFYSE